MATIFFISILILLFLIFFDIIKSNLFFVKSSINMTLEFFWDPNNHKKNKSKQTINTISKHGIENKDFDVWKKKIKMKKKKKKKKNISIYSILYMRKLLFSHIFYVIVNFNIKFKLLQLFFFLYLFEDLQ